jgi:hypothetical protein
MLGPEFGFKNGAHYFVEDVMEYLKQNFPIEKSKEYWGEMAREGYVEELKKGKGKGKKVAGKSSKGQAKPKTKCSDCQKAIGDRLAIQCNGCDNSTLVDCLTNISKNRIADFTVGKENFICNKCVPNINVETLTLNTTTEAIETTNVATDDARDTNSIDEEIDRLKHQINQKDSEYESLKSKSDLLSSSLEEIQTQQSENESLVTMNKNMDSQIKEGLNKDDNSEAGGYKELEERLMALEADNKVLGDKNRDLVENVKLIQ